jgi:stage II sporulation protein D
MTAGVGDQVYGGADAEQPGATRGIERTRGLVVTYAGRVINAPYHSACGGSTAAPDEVWRATAEPYLRPVSDRIPGSDRFYCGAAPRFQWMRAYTAPELDAVIGRYLRQYATVPASGVGAIRDIRVGARTQSGRAATLTVVSDAGEYTLRGNDIRSVFRTSGGEMLNSTYFSVESLAGRSGALTQVTLRGNGYGHGVGMCQWGAIGRSRAGQSFREILATYYPGTGLAPLG